MSPAEEIRPNTVSSPEFFDTIGHQAEQLAPAADGAGQDGEDDRRVVEEIESLCMNCHDNVSPAPFQPLRTVASAVLTPEVAYRALPGSSSPDFPT